MSSKSAVKPTMSLKRNAVNDIPIFFLQHLMLSSSKISSEEATDLLQDVVDTVAANHIGAFAPLYRLKINIVTATPS